MGAACVKLVKPTDAAKIAAAANPDFVDTIAIFLSLQKFSEGATTRALKMGYMAVPVKRLSSDFIRDFGRGNWIWPLFLRV